MYHLGYFSAATNPPQLVGQFQSPTPFHSVATGQHVQMPNGIWTVRDVTHTVQPVAGGLDCYMSVLVQQGFAAGLAEGGGGGTNPVPWPWK